MNYGGGMYLLHGDWRQECKGSRALITAPDDDVLSVADCKSMLGITGAGQDDMIEAAIGAVIATLDPAFGGSLGRALRPQTWEFRLWGFPIRGIDLPFPPLISIVSVTYTDQNGVDQTLVEGTGFRVLGLGTRGKQAIVPLYQNVWPNTRSDAESVRIRYTCGYSGDDLPKPIIHAVGLAVRSLLSSSERNLYQSQEIVPGVRERRWIVSDVANNLIQTACDNLLSTYRVWG